MPLLRSLMQVSLHCFSVFFLCNPSNDSPVTTLLQPPVVSHYFWRTKVMNYSKVSTLWLYSKFDYSHYPSYIFYSLFLLFNIIFFLLFFSSSISAFSFQFSFLVIGLLHSLHLSALFLSLPSTPWLNVGAAVHDYSPALFFFLSVSSFLFLLRVCCCQ